MMVGSGRAAALGIFMRSGEVLERLAKVDRVVFDKTGTLTERRAEVTVVTAVPGASDEEVLALAAAVEADSDHPIASAIRAPARPGTGPPTSDRSPGSGCGPDRRPRGRGRPAAGELPSAASPIEDARRDRGETVVAVRGTASGRGHRGDHAAPPRGGAGGRPSAGNGSGRPS